VRRPRRTWRWEGHVEELSETSIWAHILPVDHEGPEVGAEFDRAMCRSLDAVGQYLTLYVHRRGKRVRAVLRPKVIAPLTAEQLEQIRANAARMAAELDRLAA
jgi:hypothetical protein